jgi:hypothetical protein
VFESEQEKARELESATHKALGHIEHAEDASVHEISETRDNKALGEGLPTTTTEKTLS